MCYHPIRRGIEAATIVESHVHTRRRTQGMEARGKDGPPSAHGPYRTGSDVALGLGGYLSETATRI